MIIATALFCGNSINIVIIGLPFMKKEPHHLTCKINGVWESCTKDYICSNNLAKSNYMLPDRHSDGQYIYNWVE